MRFSQKVRRLLVPSYSRKQVHINSIVCTPPFFKGEDRGRGGGGVKIDGGITIVCSVFTFLTEASFSHKIYYSYPTRISIVFCFNISLSQHLFKIIILIVFSLISSLRYFLFTFYLQPN